VMCTSHSVMEGQPEPLRQVTDPITPC